MDTENKTKELTEIGSPSRFIGENIAQLGSLNGTGIT
jgi:hypothetical protein